MSKYIITYSQNDDYTGPEKKIQAKMECIDAMKMNNTKWFETNIQQKKK